MYHFDFTLISVPLDELKRERDNLYYAEIGADYF